MNALKSQVGPVNQQPFHVECKFDRSSATFKPEEIVTGSISVFHASSANFTLDVESISVTVWGAVTVQGRQSKPQTEQFAKRVKPIILLSIPEISLCKTKTITQDNKFPFRFKLQSTEHKFLQTYIGVYITISYQVKVHVRINSVRKVDEDTPFYLQVPKAGRDAIEHFDFPKKKHFMVVSGEMKGQKGKVPVFKIRGQLQSEYIFFNDDLHGSIIIDLADAPIRSIDLQMLRIQKAEMDFKTMSQKTEIQLIQICDGNVTRNIEVPLYMILPRYYSCPSVKYLWCHINFQVNLQIIFKDGYKVLVNIPIKLVRS